MTVRLTQRQVAILMDLVSKELDSTFDDNGYLELKSLYRQLGRML